MKKPGEIIFLVILLGLFIFLFFNSINLPEGEPGTIGPGAWPMTVTGLLIVIIAGMLGKEAVVRLSARARPGDDKQCQQAVQGDTSQVTGNEGETEDLLKHDAPVAKMLIFSAAIFIYIYLIQFIGFIFSTPLFMTAILKIQKHRMHPIAFILYTIGGTLILVVVFSYLFNIYLPRGTGIFRALSRAIY